MSSAPFPPTCWTLILSAKDDEPDARGRAMQELALVYWKPIYVWVRGRGRTHEEAQDDTQGFFSYLLEREFLANVTPDGGRFRNFLLVSLRRWMKDDCNRAINVKRREEVGMQPWYENAEPAFQASALSPEEAFDRAWAAALVERTMLALEQRWENRPELFQELRLVVEGGGCPEKHAVIGDRLGMTENAVNKAAYDLRQQFAGMIRQAVRDTVATEDNVREELLYLVRLMQS